MIAIHSHGDVLPGRTSHLAPSDFCQELGGSTELRQQACAEFSGRTYTDLRRVGQENCGGCRRRESAAGRTPGPSPGLSLDTQYGASARAVHSWRLLQGALSWSTTAMELAAQAPRADGSYQVTSSFGRSVAVKIQKCRSRVANPGRDRQPVRHNLSVGPRRSRPRAIDPWAPSPAPVSYAGRAHRYEILPGIHTRSPQIVPAGHAAGRQRPLPRNGIEGDIALDPRGDRPGRRTAASAAVAGAAPSRGGGRPPEREDRPFANSVGPGERTHYPFSQATSRHLPGSNPPHPHTCRSQVPSRGTGVAANGKVREHAAPAADCKYRPRGHTTDWDSPATRSGTGFRCASASRMAPGRSTAGSQQHKGGGPSDPSFGEAIERLPGSDLRLTLEAL